MISSYDNPAAVKISKVDIVKFDGSDRLSLLGQAYQLDIYEGIFNPVIHFELMLIDPVDLKNTYPIVGEEFLEVEFNSPNYEGKPAKYRFAISSVEQVKHATNNTGKMFVMRGDSEEVLYDSMQLVNRRYNGIELHTIVQAICSEYLQTNKSVNIERTKGPQDIMMLKKRAFVAIDMLRQRASSAAGNESHLFLFFENRYGFNFITLESLFDQNSKNIGDRRFFLDTMVNSDVRNMNYRNILALENLSTVNSVKKLHDGGVNNRVVKYDFFTGDKTVIDTNLSDLFSKVKLPNPNPFPISSPQFLEKYAGEPTNTMLLMHDSSRPETNLSESVGPVTVFTNMIVQNIFLIRTYGDSVMTAGDVIELNLPQMNSYSKPKVDEDKLQAGNYLVSRIRHNIMFGARQEYYNALELINGSFIKRT